MTDRWPTAVRIALLLLGPALFALGLAITPALDDLLARPLRLTVVLWLAPMLLSLLLAVLLRRRVADVLAMFWGGLLLVFAGPLPLLSTLLLAAAALALGSRIVPRRAPPLQVALGLVLIAGTLGWLLALPVHVAWIYWPALLALLAWGRQAVADAARGVYDGWRAAVDAAPRSAAWAIATVGLLSTAAWLPTLQHDDVAYHLGLPSQLLQLGYYRLDAQSQMWALAPWASDLLQGIVQVLAGQEGRGALNMLWLGLLAASAWRLVRALGDDAVAAWAAVALIASFPPLLWLVGGMQVELPAAALATAIALLLVEANDDETTRTQALALLAGGLLAMKASHGLLLLPLGLWWLLQRRGRLPWRALPAAVAAAVFVAASSYVHAWAISGNPLLPLFNDWFPNAYVHGQGLDLRWHEGLTWNLPWQMAFYTERYVEAQRGGNGFLLLTLLGGTLVSLLHRPTRPLACAAWAAWLLPLLFLQYSRYLVPAMVLMVPALVVGSRQLAGPRLRLGMLVLVLAWGADVTFFANGSWMWRAGAVKRLLDRDEGRAQLYQDFLPERALAETLRERHDLRLLVLGPDPAYAEYGGRAFAATSYDPELAAAVAAARQDGSSGAWAALFARFGFSHVSLQPGDSPTLETALPALGAVREQALGHVELWRLPRAAEARDLMRERDVALRMRQGDRARNKPASSPAP